MSIGLIGKKCGMTRVFTEAGASIPVTVVEVTPNRVSQVKTVENDGYRSLQVTAGERAARHVNKPQAGHFRKAGVAAGRGTWEFRLADNEGEDIKIGAEIKVDIFSEGQKVDVTGTTRGKGFAGAVKRHNFHMQRATHGNSLSHRALGSTGQCQTPGRVFKGKKMAGQMGNVRCTVGCQEIIKVDLERNLLLIKGTVPGAPGGDVIIKLAVKANVLENSDGA